MTSKTHSPTPSWHLLSVSNTFIKFDLTFLLKIYKATFQHKTKLTQSGNKWRQKGQNRTQNGHKCTQIGYQVDTKWKKMSFYLFSPISTHRMPQKPILFSSKFQIPKAFLFPRVVLTFFAYTMEEKRIDFCKV